MVHQDLVGRGETMGMKEYRVPWDHRGSRDHGDHLVVEELFTYDGVGLSVQTYVGLN